MDRVGTRHSTDGVRARTVAVVLEHACGSAGALNDELGRAGRASAGVARHGSTLAGRGSANRCDGDLTGHGEARKGEGHDGSEGTGASKHCSVVVPVSSVCSAQLLAAAPYAAADGDKPEV